MTCETILNLVGLSLNLTGSIFLAISLGRYLKSVDTSFSALETSIKTLAGMLNNSNNTGVLKTFGNKRTAILLSNPRFFLLL